MNKAELVAAIAEEAGITKTDTGRILDALVKVAQKELSTATGRLQVSGLGTFSVVARAERTGRNPQTGDRIQVEAKRVVKFKPAAELKRAVNE